MSRVGALADRPVPKATRVSLGAMEGITWNGRTPYVNLVPLDEIIGEAIGVGAQSKAVRVEYEKLIQAVGSELGVLMEHPIEAIAQVAKPEVALALGRVRLGKLSIEPGYDGEYGKVRIFREESDRKAIEVQRSLF